MWGWCSLNVNNPARVVVVLEMGPEAQNWYFADNGSYDFDYIFNALWAQYS
jgi:hypothetical protein